MRFAILFLAAAAMWGQTSASTVQSSASALQSSATLTIQDSQLPANTSKSVSLSYGEKYGDDRLRVMVMPKDPDHPEQFLLALMSNQGADYAIVEVYFWSEVDGIQTTSGHPLRIMRHKTQVVELDEKLPSMSEPFPVLLDKVAKLTFRLVTQRGTVELWNLGDEPKEVKQP